MVRLVFKDRAFTEGREESGEAVLILDEATSTARLEYAAGTGLIMRRTARRQADNIVRSGYLLANGKRIGAGFKIDESDEDQIDDRLLQEGHKYR